jgi:oxalate decarboxylase
MDASVISALAALLGAGIGGLTSVLASWLNQHTQARAQWLAQDKTRRQELYKEFIEEASRSHIAMKPTLSSPGGDARVVDSTNFPISTGIAAAMVTIKPGAMREMHWHPNASEWQYWIKGKGRMTVVTTGATARTVDFNANDVGYVPSMAGHCIENTGSEDLVFLEMFKSPRFQDISLNEWIARMPDGMAQAHLKLPISVVRHAPQTKLGLLAK